MQLSQEIFNILKGANIKLKLFDPEGNKTLDPESSARFYAYDNDFLITIRDEEDGVELVVQAGASFNFDEHKDVLNSIKNAGHNAMAEYNIRKFDKNIELKDFAHDVVKEENEEIRRLKELSGINSAETVESYSPGDENEAGYVSNCCGAPIADVSDGIGRCSDCKEMAEAEKESEYFEGTTGSATADAKLIAMAAPIRPNAKAKADAQNAASDSKLIKKAVNRKRNYNDDGIAPPKGHHNTTSNRWAESSVNEEPVFPEEVELAGDSRWIEDEMWESDYIEVSDVTVETDEDGYTQVHVEHNGPWEIYTDTGFEKEISKLVGKDVHWSEQGMQAQGVAHLEAYTNENVTEGYKPATGSLKTSYIQLPESTRLIIRHSKGVNEEIRGSRSRNIKALFIENSSGERFRFPHKYLQGAKAMANHVSHGGTPYDAIGESIVNLCTEVAQCSQFLRHIRTNKLTNEGNENIVETIKQKLKEFKNTVKSLQTSKGYNAYQAPTTAIVEENDKESVDLTNKFMYNTFTKTANMDAVLETVARIIKERDEMTDLTKSNMNRLFDMIKNKEDFQLNIDPNDPEHPDNEDPIKYSGGQGAMAKLVSHLSFLAMNSKNDEVFNLLSQISSEMYSLPDKHIILLAKIAKYLDQNNKAPASATAKEPAENIAESMLNDLRRKIA